MKSQSTHPHLYGSNISPNDQRTAFTNAAIPVAVYGLGKMGLPLATVFAETTGNTVGVDIDEKVVEQVGAGKCPVENEPGLEAAVASTVSAGSLRTSSDPVAAASSARVHVVIVPTTLKDDREPNLQNLRTAVRDIGRGLSSGDLVVIESTVPPGTCSELVAPLLGEESGLSSTQFGVAFCPERTYSGRAIQDIRGAHPKVVGGIDAESTRAATLIYEQLVDNEVIQVSDATTAEAVKIFEGVYRDVNIALANELSGLTDEWGIDVNEAISVANTQPYCQIHDPGPGVGGHCIPYYPYFLLSRCGFDAKLVRTARETNERMPNSTVQKLLNRLVAQDIDPADASILLFGVTYRPGVKETRESPTLAIAELLSEQVAEVFAVDPMLDDMSEVEATPVTLDEIYDLDLDGVVMITPHEEFNEIDWSALDGQVVIDGRNTLGLTDSDRDIYTIGSG
ncbi:nucleotide sugar dehydrogenase [Halorarius litoreus]|uniref:nucleotide sugar dehydrogenase n=1 Tax=Halorarius litoreus TaxID=2962676 RepID=UPI0020CE9729|nr:nucleotide sugar dehydrogenase [Halorarius litoreus]